MSAYETFSCVACGSIWHDEEALRKHVPECSKHPLALECKRLRGLVAMARRDALEAAAKTARGAAMDDSASDWEAACVFVAERIEALAAKEQP